MKRLLLLLCVMGCGIPVEEQSATPTPASRNDRAQQAVTDAVGAIVRKDPKALLSVWMPSRRSMWGGTETEQLAGASRFIDQQIEGTVQTYGAASPKLLGLYVSKIHPGTLTATIGIGSTPGPKELNLFEDTDGRIYWAGLWPAGANPNQGDVIRGQYHVGVPPKPEHAVDVYIEATETEHTDSNWKAANYSSLSENMSHHIESGWKTDGTDAFHFTGCDIECCSPRYGGCGCWGTDIAPGHWLIDPSSMLEVPVPPWSNNYYTIQSNHVGSAYQVKMQVPNNAWYGTAPGWACGTDASPSHYGTTSCCYYNATGIDFYWNAGGAPEDLPYCHAGTCS